MVVKNVNVAVYEFKLNAIKMFVSLCTLIIQGFLAFCDVSGPLNCLCAVNWCMDNSNQCYGFRKANEMINTFVCQI